ncbi:MAG TPA: cytochrome c [Candidatus Limnocylindria bacterium]|jgi:mono/diheme cytochrome c family protein
MTIHTPIESRTRGIPGWALTLTGVMVLAGALFFATNLKGSNPPILGTPQPSGSGGGLNAQSIIKAAGCQACHGPDLAGQAAFPTLHGVKNGPISKNLQQLGKDHPDDWANLWIAGTDPALAGIARNGMPVFAGPKTNLSPEEIATVVEYLKTLP